MTDLGAFLMASAIIIFGICIDNGLSNIANAITKTILSMIREKEKE